jgi:hypothetical protein
MRDRRPPGDRPAMTTHAPSIHRAPLLAAVAVTILVALLVSACGESQAQKDANLYADNLCSDISSWQQEIVIIAESLDSGTAKSVAKAKLDRAAAVTSSLVSDIHQLDAPSVDGAEQAKRDVDQFVLDSVSTVASVKAGASRLATQGTGATNVALVVVPVGLQLTNLVKDGKSTVASIGQVKGPFEKAVKKSDACKALKPST